MTVVVRTRSRRAGCTRLTLVGLALAAIMLAIPSVAAADEGSVPPNVPYASNPQGGAGNSFSAPYQWWKVALKKGDVLKASLQVTSEAGDDVYLSLYLPGTTHKSQNTKVATAPFTYTATQSGDYLFCVFSFDYSSTAYTFTWERTAGPPPPPLRLSTPVAPARMSAGKAATVFGFLQPQHRAGTKPVRIYKYKKVGPTWRSYGFQPATVTNYKASSRYSVRLVLPSKGVWRIRALYVGSADYPKAWSSKYDTIAVR